MHGAGEQQHQQTQQQQQQRYRFTPRNVDQNLQPTTSSQTVVRVQTMQASIICTPTTSTTSPSTSSINGNAGGQRSQTIMRFGKPIKIGDSILEPAGTLVFAPNEAPTWSTGQRIVVHGNNHAVVQANLFPIGGNPPVLTVQTPTQISNGNWFMSQQSTSNNSSVSIVPLPMNSSGTSSATPDSGIQSVPNSPPSPHFELMNDREADTFETDEHEDNDDDDDPADFTDMPTLKPVDEDDDCYDGASTSAGPMLTEEYPTASTSSPIPSMSTPPPTKNTLPMSMISDDILSIASNMEPAEIVRRFLAFDPDKANSVALLIKKKSAEESKKKKDMEAEVSSTTPTTPRARFTRKSQKCATRSTHSPDVTTSNLPVESANSPIESMEDSVESERGRVKRRGRKPKNKRPILKEEIEDEEVDSKRQKVDLSIQEQASTSQESTSASNQDASSLNPVQFRLKVREMLEKQLGQLTEKMSLDMDRMKLAHSTTTKSGKRKDSFLQQLTKQSDKMSKLGVPVVKRTRMYFSKELPITVKMEAEEIKKEIKEEIVASKGRGRLSSRRSRVEDSPDVVFAPVEEKFNGEYYEIVKSVPYSEDIIPLWRAPSLSCGCTKGACTSDMECLNRALRVQCSNECTLSYCSNRRFWKEACGNKLRISSGLKTKRVLKTKLARKPGEFLCEYAGEVINSRRAQEIFKENADARIVAIGSQLFIDATNKGNVARFIKHSCKPNSRLEVWSVNGFYRAGVFSLTDMTTNMEVTIDKDGLLPFDAPCECGSDNCKKVIRGVRSICRVTEDENEKMDPLRRFQPRNRRNTIVKSRQSGLPSILLLEDNSTLLLKMKKVLAAFSFRVRRIDGTMPRSMLPYYSTIQKYLKIASGNLKLTEFVSFFLKWLDVIDDDDMERAFIAIESHYLFSSILSSALAKKSKESAPRARAPSVSCQSPTNSKRGDADLTYLESLYPIGSYDPDDAWESYKPNSEESAVRCICGALDEDGGMVQCDGCHFWLHVDCCKSVDVDGDFTCEFCRGTQTGQRPIADVKLHEQPQFRFENCVYYRSLVNRRGIQVRLNETVYVNKQCNDDHKVILRNLREAKKGGHKEPNKYKFPKASTEPIPPRNVDRKNARIFRIERLFTCPGNNRFVFGSFYAYPHETYADNARLFCKKEVFATPHYETLPLDEVIGRCLVVDKETWCAGRPKVPKFREDDVFMCETQVGKTHRVFEKLSQKNQYPINVHTYVFTKFTRPMKVIRDFRPYDKSKESPKPPKAQISPVPSQSVSKLLPAVDMKTLSKNNIDNVGNRLRLQNS